MEEVAALRQFVVQHQIVIMVHKDVILTEPAEAAERNSQEAMEELHGQVYLQEDKPVPSVKEDKGGLGQLLQMVVDTMAAEVEETLQEHLLIFHQVLEVLVFA